MFGINPWVILAVVIAFAASNAWTYSFADGNVRNEFAAEQLKEVKQTHKRTKVAAEESQAQKNARKQLNNSIDEKVVAYAPTESARADCFSDADLMLYNSIDATLPVPGGRSATVH